MAKKTLKTVDGWFVQGQHMPWLHKFYPSSEYPDIEMAFAQYVKTYDTPEMEKLRKYTRDLRGWRVTQTVPKPTRPRQ